MNDIEEYNIKWLEYMNNVNINKVTKCPNRHKLIAYSSFILIETLIITYPKDTCNYYDHNTFRVSSNTKLSIRIDD